MTAMPLVSILIPAYNAEATLAATIESALGQTWPNKEIIVVDDGSKDGTLAVARTFSDRGVIVHAQSNQGAAAARNKAFSLSKGEYIQWLDSDDLLAPDKISRQLEAQARLDSDKILLSSGWAYFMYRPRNARFVPTALWENLSPAEWLTRKLDQNLHMQTGTWLVSRALTEAAGLWDTRLLSDDDGEYFCRVLQASNGVHFVPGPAVFYRRTVGSLSKLGLSDRKTEMHFVSMKLHIEYLRSMEDSDRVKMACVKYLQRYLIYFHPERPDICKEAQEIAAGLGGKLETPRLPWKYEWIQKLFGWHVGKSAWVFLPRFRESLARHWDKFLFSLETRKGTQTSLS